MSYPINYPTPQNCDVQIFYGQNKGASANAPIQDFDWIKPKGTSFVWFTLIGGGGGGGNSDATNNQGGGGSGAVTNCLMPAFLVPDQLKVRNDSSSTVFITYQGQNLAAGYDLLSAVGGGVGSALTGGTGGTASVRTAFAAAGLYQSVAGQNSASAGNVTPSNTTFLSAGSTTGFTVRSNYGYPTGATTDGTGFFQISPIIVGRGGTRTTAGDGICGGVGCGGGGASTTVGAVGGVGGQSLAVIISW